MLKCFFNSYQQSLQLGGKPHCTNSSSTPSVTFEFHNEPQTMTAMCLVV